MCDYLAAEVARLGEMPQQPLVNYRDDERRGLSLPGGNGN